MTTDHSATTAAVPAPRARPSIAIVGAGFSGIVLARELRAVADVQVFDKARGVGGRLSTRRVSPFAFDHGQAHFTARSRAFRDFLAPLQAAGLVREWRGKLVSAQADGRTGKRDWFEPHWVGCPGMSSLVKALATECDVRPGTEVAPLPQAGPPWILHDVQGAVLGSFDWVISTTPAPQTLRLLEGFLPAGSAPARAVMQPIHALLAGFAQPWQRGWIGAKVHDSPLDWVWVDSSKPGRDPAQTCLVAHTTPQWSAAHVEDEPAALAAELLSALAGVTGLDAASAGHVAVHRWRFATVVPDDDAEPWVDERRQLMALGDWSCGARLESLWHQAMALAKRWRSLH